MTAETNMQNQIADPDEIVRIADRFIKAWKKNDSDGMFDIFMEMKMISIAGRKAESRLTDALIACIDANGDGEIERVRGNARTAIAAGKIPHVKIIY